jgi:UDPglucose 6-dehydrogenase/UDP-N-acetyl-D-galactosamine dehydrogenase
MAAVKHDLNRAIVCIVGLGYVGLPLAQAFSKSFKVIGFDSDAKKVDRLSRQAASIVSTTPANLTFTTSPKEIRKADFIIIAVPTPLTKSKEPDLSFVKGASEIVGQNIKRGATVILESTVYPGVTEEVVKPILEGSGLRCGADFKLAYSPERINPGDKEHTLDKITKVVAGMDDETTELVAQLYSKVTPYIFKAKDIKTAEAAKVIENIQRDLNIALMNELSLIFDKLGLSTRDILEAASTKWNFHPYSPGLVGGHCIPVDPYYLVYKAKELGYHPQVILAGRAINDSMAKHVAEMTIRALNNVGKVIKGSKVLIMGLTYKENVADTRETPTKEIIKQLEEYGVDIFGYDPLLNDVEGEFGIKSSSNPEDISGIDCIILAVAHEAFKEITLDRLRGIMNFNPILIDVRGLFEAAKAREKGFHYLTL